MACPARTDRNAHASIQVNDEVAVRVDRGESCACRSRSCWPLAALDRMEYAGGPQLVVERLDALDLDAAARRSGQEGLAPEHTGRSRRSSRLRQLSSLDSHRWTTVVPAQDREAAVVMERLEAEPDVVERD